MFFKSRTWRDLNRYPSGYDSKLCGHLLHHRATGARAIYCCCVSPLTEKQRCSYPPVHQTRVENERYHFLYVCDDDRSPPFRWSIFVGNPHKVRPTTIFKRAAQGIYLFIIVAMGRVLGYFPAKRPYQISRARLAVFRQQTLWSTHTF